MADVIQFPRTRLTPAEELSNRWDAAAGAALRRFAWMWPDDVPHWVCASWAGYVDHWRRDHPMCAPENAPWDKLWTVFVHNWLGQQESFKRAVAQFEDAS